MNKILLIGNSGYKHQINDGQTVKIRMYLQKIKDEGFEVQFIDLEDFSYHIFSILRSIKKGIKECDRIVLLSAERGSKILIPFINHYNKKKKKIFVLPLIGIGVLHSIVDRLNDDEKVNFMSTKDYSHYKKNLFLSNQLKKIDFILPETELIGNVYTNYFGLDNVHVLNNFRETKIPNVSNYKPGNVLRTIYISRIWREKGIFDLLAVVNAINRENNSILLDIYGPKESIDVDNMLFDSIVDKSDGISYFGSIKENEVIDIISSYDLLVFPTRYFGEGTPGIISESLMAGTPILTSDFLQARYLLNDGFDSIFFKMMDKNDLKRKLSFLVDNRDLLLSMRKNALESGKKFSYETSRSTFLKFVCGVSI